jgi:hypothetical protein
MSVRVFRGARQSDGDPATVNTRRPRPVAHRSCGCRLPCAIATSRMPAASSSRSAINRQGFFLTVIAAIPSRSRERRRCCFRAAPRDPSRRRRRAQGGAAIGRLSGSIRPAEFDAVGHEQDRRGRSPAGLEPTCFGAGVKQRRAGAVACKPLDPLSDHVPVEGRIEPHAAAPGLRETVACPVLNRAVPWTWIRGTRIEVERPEPIEDPARRDVVLRPANSRLVAAERHGSTAASLKKAARTNCATGRGKV